MFTAIIMLTISTQANQGLPNPQNPYLVKGFRPPVKLGIPKPVGIPPAIPVVPAPIPLPGKP